MTKHRYTKFQNLRYILSYPLSLLQLFHSAPKRKYGISVMLRVRDEEEWIARSLLSLNEFADEVIVVNNNSADNTLAEIEKVRERLKYALIVEDETSNDICKVSNHALDLTSYRWIFRWDADFIAYTSQDRNIKNLRNYLLKLNPRKMYLIFPQTYSFAGDLFHVKTDRETNSEGYIHTWHPGLKYKKKGKYEILHVPYFYKIKRIAKYYFVHLGSAKPLQKLLFRFFWLYWQFHLQEFSKIEQFIQYEADKNWNGLNPEQIAVQEFKRLILPVRKFDTNEFGEYPELMIDKVKDPDFRITYKNGKPFSRSDFPK